MTADGAGPDVAVLREGTEGLDAASYAECLAERLPHHEVRLARTPGEEQAMVATAPVVTGVRIDEDLLARAQNLDLFACVFAGTDHLPMDALSAAGVAVTNAGGIHVPGIAEQAVGYLLVFARRLDEGWRRGRRAEWRHFQSSELAGSTVTILGLGSIGRAIATRLAAFDVHTVGVRYTPAKGGPTDEVLGYDRDGLQEAFARSDYLVVACPLTSLTRGLVDAEAFESLPPHAVVANVARGPIIDTDALVDALGANAIGGAALDVTDPEPLPADHPLWRFDNVLITAHTGGHNPRHWERMADIVAENVARLEGGEPPSALRNLVNRPVGGEPAEERR